MSGKIVPLKDEMGDNLPKNMATQFRNVQHGIEYLKEASDDITTELKGVNKKLSVNTSDLKEITKKINEIEKRQVEHMNITKNSISELKKVNSSVITLLMNINNRLNAIEPKK